MNDHVTAQYEAAREKERQLGALTNEYEEVRESMKKAAQYARQSAPESKAATKWQDVYDAGSKRLVEIVDEKREVRAAALRGLDDESVVKQLAGAMNRSYEATMGDYSMGSINGAAADVEAAETVLRERGYEAPKDLVTYESGRLDANGRPIYSGWVPKSAVTA